MYRRAGGSRAAVNPDGMVGRTPWSAADAPVGRLAPYRMLTPAIRQRDEGVPRGPEGPPHQAVHSHAYSI